MATPLLLYLCNEASSGTSPTALLDTSTGTAVNLPITYGTSAWSAIAAGDGLTFDGTCGALSPALNGSKVETALAGSKTCTFEVVANVRSSAATQTIVSLGGVTFLFTLQSDFGQVAIGVNGSSVGTFALAGTGLHVYHLVLDTTQGTASLRVQLYIDGVLQTLSGASFPTQNSTIDSNSPTWSNNKLSVGCEGAIGTTSLTNGTVYYAAVYTAALDQTTITANTTALLANNDANPNITLPVITSQPQTQRVREGQTATFNITATGTGVVHYAWTSNGSGVGTDANSYTTGPATMADNGSVIQCTVTDDVGSTVSTTAILVVYEVPAVAWLTA